MIMMKMVMSCTVLDKKDATEPLHRVSSSHTHLCLPYASKLLQEYLDTEEQFFLRSHGSECNPGDGGREVNGKEDEVVYERDREREREEMFDKHSPDDDGDDDDGDDDDDHDDDHEIRMTMMREIQSNLKPKLLFLTVK